ncbi:MAG: hypothetical protein JWQ81_5144 [Amycolatopsis sp.]|jgi:hypothetical protein|uniref:hypothetical protein n=1 Tax=Amycolatopsis sp. TaxID=37632 RepID=UPI00261CA9C1|nr:hypothetical protein [Amycolatopsis sp.]MCU1684405.1 hypothetical protein [Amycolatopsis sp.]
MNGSNGGDAGRDGRWVAVTLQNRQVCLDPADESGVKLSYAGILIVHYECGTKVSETWLPLGGDPSEEDDEQLIRQLREALLWQAGKRPDADAPG